VEWWLGLGGDLVPGSLGRTRGTTTASKCLAWGEAGLWWLDLENGARVRRFGGGATRCD
jgi:hypothetical protein